MRQFGRTAISTAILLWSLAGAVQAASLGKLQVLSAAGQPMLAEIDIDGLAADDFASLRIGLADPASYKAAQLEQSPLLDRLRFEVVRGLTPDRATVRITSVDPIPARFVDALLQLTWASGSVQREYTIPGSRPADANALTIQAPDLAPVDHAATAPAASSAPATAANAAPATKPVTVAATAAPADRMVQAGARTVARGESLGQIAREVAPDPKAVNAAMAAIFEKNRSAFIGNSIHLLREGAVLDIPQPAELTRRSNQAALQMLAQFDDRADPYFQRMAANPVAVKPTQTADSSSTGEIGKVEPERPAPKGDDQLKVSRSRKDDKSPEAINNAQAEELLIKEKALREANDRIAALEKNIADMQRLIELKTAAGKPDSATSANDKAVADTAVAADPAAKDDAGQAKPAAVESELKPDTTATDTSKPEAEAKPEAELADEQDDEHDKKHTPWYRNSLVLAGAGGAVVLGGGVGGFLYYRRRRSADAAQADAMPDPLLEPQFDPLADPSADLLNADLEAAAAATADDDPAAQDAESAASHDDAASDPSAADTMLADAAETEAAQEDAASATAETASDFTGNDSNDVSGEAAELSAAAVDLDFESADAAQSGTGVADDAASTRPESLLPPEMTAGDPPKPPGQASNFADELEALSAKVNQAQQALQALRNSVPGISSASSAAADTNAVADTADAADFDAEADEMQAPADSASLQQQDPQAAQRISESLAGIDLDLPGADDPLLADPLADPIADLTDGMGSDASALASDFATKAVAQADAGFASNADASPPTDKDELARWQEMETKLDLAAAYIEIGDSESARDLLNEVLKKGGDTQRSRASELLSRAD